MIYLLLFMFQLVLVVVVLKYCEKWISLKNILFPISIRVLFM